jgi:peptidoglycan-associated lipoprotein
MFNRQRITSYFLALGAVFALAACGSSVKLDDVPISDAKGTQVSPVPSVGSGTSTLAQGTQTGVAERNVQPVNVASTASDATGPAGIAKVILFDYDSYVIKPQYQNAIDAHARFLASNKNRKLAIEGHTDESGGREYNLALGQKRAEAVRRALGLLGATDSQVEAVSFGEEKPLDSGNNEQAYAKNRRAELYYK